MRKFFSATQTAIPDDPTPAAEASSASFRSFVERIRAGDDRAAEELVRTFEPLIRTEVRLRLHDPRLCRIFDSVDICQSVLGSFFLRAAAGQYDLDSPRHLVQLLVAMTRNKLAVQVRRQYRDRRDIRRVSGEPIETVGLAGREDPPSTRLTYQELLTSFRARLSPEERQLAELRAANLSWDTIAGHLGGSPHARRKQLARAVERVARDLGLED